MDITSIRRVITEAFEAEDSDRLQDLSSIFALLQRSADAYRQSLAYPENADRWIDDANMYLACHNTSVDADHLIAEARRLTELANELQVVHYREQSHESLSNWSEATHALDDHLNTHGLKRWQIWG